MLTLFFRKSLPLYVIFFNKLEKNQTVPIISISSVHANTPDTPTYMPSTIIIGSGIGDSNLDLALGSLCATLCAYEKSMNSSVLPPSYREIVGQTRFFSLD